MKLRQGENMIANRAAASVVRIVAKNIKIMTKGIQIIKRIDLTKLKHRLELIMELLNILEFTYKKHRPRENFKHVSCTSDEPSSSSTCTRNSTNDHISNSFYYLTCSYWLRQTYCSQGKSAIK